MPGAQGRLAFVYLATHRHATVGRDELAEIIWPEEPPPKTEVAFSAILSKLRGALKRAGLSDEAAPRGPQPCGRSAAARGLVD